MQRTVPVDEETATYFPGARYGLGLLQRPLPCGGTYWAPGGDQVGWVTRTGITLDGRRSVVASLSTQLADIDGAVQKEEAATALVEHALCGRR